jgi:multiple sugar transport system substrate-binding protein
MKSAFAIACAVFLAMYLVAEATLQRPPADGIVRIRWSTDPNPARTIQANLFHKLNPRYEVIIDPDTAGDSSKIIVQCSTGSGPDLIDVYSTYQMTALVDAGVLLDLTPYARAGRFDVDHTYPSLRASLMVDGRQYRFPCNVYGDCIIYNKRIFDDHRVPYPKASWTYEDFVRTAEAIRDRPSISGRTHMPIASAGGFYNDLLAGYGGTVFTPDGLHCAMESPAALSALRFYTDLIYRYHLLPTPAESAALSAQGGWGSGGINWFSNGQAAMIPLGRWYTVQLPNYPGLQGALGAVTLPHVGARDSSSIVDSRAAAINVHSPHRAAALAFMKYLTTPEYNQDIRDDGDSLPPNPEYVRSGSQLVNATVKDPAFHQAFIDEVRTARVADTTPFMDSATVSRWVSEAVDSVSNRLATPETAMHRLTTEIDRQIRINLERRPDLRERFQRVTGRSWRSDW